MCLTNRNVLFVISTVLCALLATNAHANPVMNALQDQGRWIGASVTPAAATVSRELSEQSLCTQVYLPPNGRVKAIEFGFFNHTANQWVGAHWGDLVVSGRPSHYLGPLPPVNSALQRLSVDPTVRLPAGSAAPTDQVSAGAWTLHYVDGNIQTWIDDCFSERSLPQFTEVSYVLNAFPDHINSFEYVVQGGEHVCTKAYFPDDSGEISDILVAIELRRNGAKTVLSTQLSADDYLNPGENWQTFSLSLENAFTDDTGASFLLGPGDAVSPTVWMVSRGGIIDESWTSTCFTERADVAPTIQFIGGSTQFISSLSVFNPNVAATCTDNIDPVCSLSHDFETAQLAPVSPGVYRVTYTATDSDGNVATSVLTLQVDGVPPEIDPVREPIEHTEGTRYQDIAECLDAKWGRDCEIDLDVLDTGFDVDNPAVGTYTLALSARDPSGNQTAPADRVLRTVIVLPKPSTAVSGKLNSWTYDVTSGLVKTLDERVESGAVIDTGVLNLSRLNLQHETSQSRRAQVFKGFLYPDQTGYYTFWIASTDETRLLLSTDEGPENKALVSRVAGTQHQWTPRFTAPFEWNKYPDMQQSAPRWLTAGQRYYLEIHHAASRHVGTTSHFQVAWRKPFEEGAPPNDDSWLIPASQISVFEDGKPVISLNGADALTMAVGETYRESATCFDAEDGECALNVTGLVNDGDTLSLGTYMITYQAVDSAGNMAIEQSRTIDVIEAASSGPPLVMGKMNHETWSIGGSGRNINDLNNNSNFPGAPATSGIIDVSSTGLQTAAAPSKRGQRLRGYLIPSESGEYRFWIASSDESQLWLSTDDDPSGSNLLAQVRNNGFGWTPRYDWDKFGGQASSPVTLIAGQRYYIEVRHVASGASPNRRAEVSWRLPSASGNPPENDNWVVPGENLAVFEDLGPVIDLNGSASVTLSTGFPYTELATCTDVADGNCLTFDIDYGTLTDVASPAAGVHTLTYTATDSSGNVSEMTRTVEVKNFDTGSIRRNLIWAPANTKYVSDVLNNPNYPDSPDLTDTVPVFRSYQGGSNFGQFLRGYLIAPETGLYTFWVSSNDSSRLFISPDTDPANKVSLAEVPGNKATGDYEWTKFSQQKSTQVSLVAGQAYFIEAVHKRRWSNGDVAVAWRKPSDTADPANDASSLIPGSSLAPEQE